MQLSHRQCVFCYEWGPSFSVLSVCPVSSVFCTCTCNFLDSALVVLICVSCTPTEYSVRTEYVYDRLAVRNGIVAVVPVQKVLSSQASQLDRTSQTRSARSAKASRLRLRLRYGVRIPAWQWQSCSPLGHGPDPGPGYGYGYGNGNGDGDGHLWQISMTRTTSMAME